MKINKYTNWAALAIALTALAYFINFYIINSYKISNNPEHWAMLGDFFGGILNPILSFISITLLIRSLSLQNTVNRSLRIELKATEKSEKYRQFEALFFSLVGTQRDIFEKFQVHPIKTPFGDYIGTKRQGEGVARIETIIKQYRKGNATDSDIREILEKVDEKDCIFSVLRAFYIALKLIDDRISITNGFSEDEKKDHYTTLINLTDFAQLRLIFIAIQFLDYAPCEYISQNSAFINTLRDLGYEHGSY